MIGDLMVVLFSPVIATALLVGFFMFVVNR